MKRIVLVVLLLASASVPPIIFPAAEAGWSSLDVFAKTALFPSIAVMGLTLGLLSAWGFTRLSRMAILSLAAGALSTVALEAVRLPGFLLGFMPGNLPRLMGVLLLNQFSSGPSTLSDIAGWAYHFWNGACFGLLYLLLVGTRRLWAALVFGIVLGIGFLLSPVVSSLGAGFLGLGFSLGFPITVSLAHATYGAVLGWLLLRTVGPIHSPAWSALRNRADEKQIAG